MMKDTLSPAIVKRYGLDERPKSLLTVANPKTAKGRKYGYHTAILHLAPADLSGYEMCPFRSDGCTIACLNTAGHGGINLDENGLNSVQIARIRRTRWMMQDRDSFIIKLIDAIAAHVRQAVRHGLKPAVRLDGTSDRMWTRERIGAFANIMAVFPDVQFYDYTKVPAKVKRAIPTNYHLTFSLSESNDAHAAIALTNGVNVAVAMDVAKGDTLPKMFKLAGSYFPVIDGDLSDLRFLDAPGSIVGLRAKGRGKADTSGFVRNV